MVLQSLQGVADFIFTPILAPLLDLPSWLAILVVALGISVISVLFQKHFTDQARLKFLKKQLKKHQQEMKKVKDDPQKQMRINKKMMPLQGEMMKKSLKPTLWMMLPFLLLFLWLSANFAYEPLAPNEPFTVDASVQEGVETVLLDAPSGVTLLSPAEAPVREGVASWELDAEPGHYALSFTAAGETVTKEVVVTREKEYEQPLRSYDAPVETVEVGNAPLKPLSPLTIFGWQPGWIATYITFSLVFSILFRRWLDVA